MENQLREEQKNHIKDLSNKTKNEFKAMTDKLISKLDFDIQNVIKETISYSGDVRNTRIGSKLHEYLKKEGNKPSEFFRNNIAKFGGWVKAYLLEDFYLSIDSVIKWQMNLSYYRRSMRTNDYSYYTNRIFDIMEDYHNMGIYETDIVSVYQEKMSEEKVCYLRDKCTYIQNEAISSYWIQAELDQGNKELRAELNDILMGEDNPNSINYPLIQGIMRSSNQEMYEVLGKVMLAARLQEGLRQAICENADVGTAEGFMYMYKLIVDNDLIRYASVLRAIATWTGLIADEQQKLERIQKKQLELIYTYITDEAAREAALSSEDTVEVYLALWSYGFFNIDKVLEVLNRLVLNGSKHQRMICCYYLNVMRQNNINVGNIAKNIVKNFFNENETMAIVMNFFMDNCQMYINKITHTKQISYQKNELILDRVYADAHKYFENEAECEQFYDIMLGMLSTFTKKEIKFDPCIFPWNKETLYRSDLIIRLAFCASALRDEDKITEIAGKLSDIDASNFNRSLIVGLLLAKPQNAKQQEILVAAIADKESYTRNVADYIVDNLKLTEVNFAQLEDMLKYKNAEIRANVLKHMYKLEDEGMEAVIESLLLDKKEEKRTAGLDLLLQLKRDEDRKALFDKCAVYVESIVNPSSKEQILIDELQKNANNNKEQEEGYGIYDVNADYEPVFDKKYLANARKIFEECFPDTAINKKNGIIAKVARMFNNNISFTDGLIDILRKLDAVIETHKLDEYEDCRGNILLLGEKSRDISFVKKEDGTEIIAFSKLWIDFYEKEIKSYETVIALKVYLAGLKNDAEHFRAYCKSFDTDLFGKDFIKEITLGFLSQLNSVLYFLEKQYRDNNIKCALAVTTADYLLNSDKSLIEKSLSDRLKDSGGKPVIQKRSVVSDFWIKELLMPFNFDSSCDNYHNFDVLFPYQYALSKYHGFEIPVESDVRKYEIISHNLEVPKLLNYITAYTDGLISKDYLYKMTFNKNMIKENMVNLCHLIRFYYERNRAVSSRHHDYGWGDRQREEAIKYVLGHGSGQKLSKEDEEKLNVAKDLYEKLSSLMLETELTRGDTETEFSRCIYALKRIYGVEYFVRILAALGQETLERSTYFDSGWSRNSSVSKRQSLSHLLSVCMPKEADDSKKLSQCLKGTDIKETRLIEAALYSPEWIGIVSDYLGWEGFTAGCYYFTAHMNESFDNKRMAMIARYTPLEAEELRDGAFDLKWFREVYDKLGEKRFKAIYDAAKYISDGAKHTRARKYADAALGKYNEIEVSKEIFEKRNKDLVMAYSLIPLKDEQSLQRRYLDLQSFKKDSKQFGAQRRASEIRAVDISMQNLAINAGYQDVTRLILRMEAVEFETKKAFFEPKEVEDISVWLTISENGKCEIGCEKNGKLLKSIPAKYKKNEYIEELTENKKKFTEQYRRTKLMFEEAMESCTEFTFGELSSLLANPVTRKIVGNIVYKYDADTASFGMLAPDGLKLIADGNVLTLNDQDVLTVAHAYHLFKAGCWHVMQKYLFDNEIKQPFKQVFRELYVKTEEELNTYHSLRYAGNQIQPKQTVGCLRQRRWVADMENGLQKIYYKENIVAEIYALADWFSPADIEAPTLEWVVFTDRKTGKEVRIGDIPDIIFSEVMRDVDMAVSVAHAGSVDPETSHSTIEMRKAIAEFTMPLFKLSNVTFTKNHAVIVGERGEYTIHLGSGVIHQQAGPMINVLPVHSERRGRLFLPFVDDDPKTAEILTKILFFAEDKKIKDPFILEQIV